MPLWWSFISGHIGGVGDFRVNVGNGNLVVDALDMMAANKGVSLAFRRVYNSLSRHTYAGTDGSIPSNYGNGWTNTFDAHLSYDASTNTMTVYDADGARFDYTSGGNGTWVHPAGQYATLTLYGTNNYAWTAKNGVIMLFYNPVQPGTSAGQAGRLYGILGRNQNNSITFTYSWSPDASRASNLTQIVARAEDGRSTTLQFANFGSSRLLSTLTWPDGNQDQYFYDSSANLTQVTRPGNGSATTLSEQYNYTKAGLLQSVSTPRWVVSNGFDGSYAYFAYSAANQLINIYLTGTVNIRPADGSNTYLQPSAPVGVQTYSTGTFLYANGTTQVSDSDGHSLSYLWDSTGRVTQLQAQTGTTTLTISQGWYSIPDARANNLAFVKDPRGNETDFAYDNNGNLIAFGRPAAPTNVGTIRETGWLSYDANSNITSYCDSTFVNAHGGNWLATPAPVDNLCPGVSGATRLAYTPASNGMEPFGELVSVTKPSGYSYNFSYSSPGQGGNDFGLPTSIIGQSFSEYDGTTLTPSISLIYDASGNPICAEAGTNHWRVLQYDTMGRVTAQGDADDNALSGTACGKTTGAYQTAGYLAYYPNGALQYSETSIQKALSDPVTRAYDPDGNETSITHYYGGIQGATNKYYDGADRLVEVTLPHDSSDFYTTSWMVRYLYDLTHGGMVAIGDATYGTASFTAHGKLFKIQKYLPAPIQMGDPPGTSYSWIDVSGSAYDGLNRPTTAYFYQPGSVLRSSSRSYDAAASTLGLLGSTTNSLGDKSTFTYDSVGRVSSVQTTANPTGGSGDVPVRTFTYDPDDRQTAISTTAFGTRNAVYDADGNLTQTQEPQGGSGTAQFPGSGSPSSPATINYAYYPNGLNSTLSVISKALSQANLETYSYRDDGTMQTETVNFGGSSYSFGGTFTAGARPLTKTDPYRTGSTPAASFSYDQYGRTTTYVIPAGTYSAFTYDPEGDVTTITETASGKTVGGLSYTYNDRGELIKTGGLGGFNAQSAYGFMYPTDKTGVDPSTGLAYSIVTNFDARVGALLGTTQVEQGQPPAPLSSVFYDAAGRMTSDDNGTTHVFDAENHLLGDQFLMNQYAWDPNGHPYVFATQNGTTKHTIHWDGNQVLFTTNASGVLDDLKIGTVADVLPLDPQFSSLNVWDRDIAGTTVSEHNNTGIGTWSSNNPSLMFLRYHSGLLATATTGFKEPAGLGGSPPNSGPQSGNGLLAQPRTDGYSDGTNVIQGLRGYDPTNGLWMTTDPLSGSLVDLLSQLPYGYLRNNAVLYSDPSGTRAVVSSPVVTDTNDWSHWRIVSCGQPNADGWALCTVVNVNPTCSHLAAQGFDPFGPLFGAAGGAIVGRLIGEGGGLLGAAAGFTIDAAYEFVNQSAAYADACVAQVMVNVGGTGAAP